MILVQARWARGNGVYDLMKSALFEYYLILSIESFQIVKYSLRLHFCHFQRGCLRGPPVTIKHLHALVKTLFKSLCFWSVSPVFTAIKDASGHARQGYTRTPSGGHMMIKCVPIKTFQKSKLCCGIICTII